MDLTEIEEGQTKTVYAICRSRKDDPEEWIAEQYRSAPQDIQKMIRRISHLAAFGWTHNEQHYRHIGETLWELKAGALRLLAFDESKDIVVIVAGFRKPNPKVQRVEFAKAREIINVYCDEKAKGINRIIIDPGEMSYKRVPHNTSGVFNVTQISNATPEGPPVS